MRLEQYVIKYQRARSDLALHFILTDFCNEVVAMITCGYTLEHALQDTEHKWTEFSAATGVDSGAFRKRVVSDFPTWAKAMGWPNPL